MYNTYLYMDKQMEILDKLKSDIPNYIYSNSNFDIFMFE